MLAKPRWIAWVTLVVSAAQVVVSLATQPHECGSAGNTAHELGAGAAALSLGVLLLGPLLCWTGLSERVRVGAVIGLVLFDGGVWAAIELFLFPWCGGVPMM